MPDQPPDDAIDAELLGRYLARECSEAEAVAVRRALMANPDVARALERVLHHLDGGPSRPAPPPAASSWLVLRERLRESDRVGDRARDHATPVHAGVAPSAGHAGVARPPVGWRWPAAWRRAARTAAGAAITVAGVAYRALRREGSPATAPATRSYVTAARERSELRLPDGTRVRLAPGSHLRVAAEFGADHRDVYLEGEAFFDVVHDARRPFTVFAGNASARDVGTAFSVRAYPQDGAVTVVVREGEVALSGAGRLRAGDVGRVAADGRAAVTRGVRVDSLLDWMAGRLVYTDAPLGDVLEDLRRWYDVDVRLADASVAALPFTGTLADVSPEAAVELVAATLGLEIRREGTRLILAPTPGRTPAIR
jgi:transmembrane sensor